MIQTFTYTGITNTNYNQSGFFHTTNSRNALVRKVLNQATRLLWQVSFSPAEGNFPEKYWALSRAHGPQNQDCDKILTNAGPLHEAFGFLTR